jgi:transcriptional regulator with XRE-family HTH domain
VNAYGPYRAIGKRIAVERNRVGLSIRSACERAGMNGKHGHWGRLELGHFCPSLPTLFRMCRVLGIEVSDLLRGLRSARD